ncbi:MAG: tRNA (guanosine(46)-N7)-methyltransferase TrmB [Micromonosporaceae bacterium]|nr:tRNA (guanosine(46)-N7)-methyltransferase TrmB [Micromonosporaceae bacterium]
MTMTAAAPIRTFKLRQGRLRPRHREALHRLWPAYGVAVDGRPIDPAELFGRPVPLVLEIGTGMGEGTAAQAAADPDRGYLAVEVHTPGVANLLVLAADQRLTNLRIAHGDALELIRNRIPPASLAAIHAFFPDPWPKTRHHKRRLFQPAHVALLRSRLVPGGTLHTATDWPGYATAIRDVLAADPELVNPHHGFAPAGTGRPQTRYERRARAAGRPVFELVCHRR